MRNIKRVARLLAWPCLLALLILTALADPSCVLAVATLTSCSLRASIGWQYDNPLTGGNTPTSQFSFTYTKNLTNGTGASGTADLIIASQVVITGGSSTTIDVFGGSNDFFGTAINMARVKFFYVNLTALTTATSIAIGNAASPIINWISLGTTTVKVNNDGIFLLGDGGATGYAVTATTADGFKILNNDGSNSATVNIAIVGSSA